MAKDRMCFTWCSLDTDHEGSCVGRVRVGNDDPHDGAPIDRLVGTLEYAEQIAQDLLQSVSHHDDRREELNRAVEEAVRPHAEAKRAFLDNVKLCEQCGVTCLACGIGEIHMNIEPPYEGYTHDQTNAVDWPAHNAKGHHHVMWNGASNETVPCGSKRAYELAQYRLRQKKREEQMAERPDPNARQVGGSHYGGRPMQHWDVVVMFKLDYFQGNATKYIFRWREKGGIQDLEKARHYIEKYIEEVRAGRI